MLVQVIPKLTDKGRLYLHPQTALRLGCPHQKIGFLRWGAASHPVNVRITDAVGADEIWLSNDLVEGLSLPLFCRYELRREQNEFRIGPLIGIAAAKTQEQLARTVHSLSNSVYDYESIGGAVLAFSLEGVDRNSRRIQGYWYNPVTEEWLPGECGYPGVVFKRVGMSGQLRAHFQEVLGPRVFNETVFDKWEMYEWLSEFPEVVRHLPDSALYQDTDGIWPMLERHGQVYLKPIRGSQGLGVLRLSKEQDAVVLRFERDGTPQVLQWPDWETAAFFLEEKLKPGRYLIQQGVELLKAGDHLIDFRLLVVKNRFGEWEHLGTVARKGTSGSILSNISRGGSAEMAEVTLQQQLGLDGRARCAQVEQMTAVAVQAASGLERSGVLAGNFGVDMVLDPSGHLWILEINNLDPNHTIALDAGNRSLFYRVKRENLLYAKWLAGFADGE